MTAVRQCGRLSSALARCCPCRIDTFQAIRTVRAHASEWGLDPAKIGVCGFSAGGELAGGAAVEYRAFDEEHAATPDGEGKGFGGVSARPDFVGLIYPVRHHLGLRVPTLAGILC